MVARGCEEGLCGEQRHCVGRQDCDPDSRLARALRLQRCLFAHRDPRWRFSIISHCTRGSQEPRIQLNARKSSGGWEPPHKRGQRLILHGRVQRELCRGSVCVFRDVLHAFTPRDLTAGCSRSLRYRPAAHSRPHPQSSRRGQWPLLRSPTPRDRPPTRKKRRVRLIVSKRCVIKYFQKQKWLDQWWHLGRVWKNDLVLQPTPGFGVSMLTHGGENPAGMCVWTGRVPGLALTFVPP